MSADPKTNLSKHERPNTMNLVTQLKADNAFGKSKTQYSLFEYLYEKSESHEDVSEYSIALDVLGRAEDFDPAIDSSVRASVSRLRKNISVYNAKNAKSNGFTISFPLGSYRIITTPIIPPENGKIENRAHMGNRKSWLLPSLGLIGFVLIGLFFAAKTFNPALDTDPINQTTIDTGSVFPTVHAYIDQDTLAPSDRTEASVTLRYMENLFSGLNLFDYTTRVRAEYLVRLNYLPDQIILQLHHKKGDIIWSSEYDRPSSTDNETLKALAINMLSGFITTEDPLGNYHVNNSGIDSKLREQYRCIADLHSSTMTSTSLSELVGNYATVRELIDCIKEENLKTPKEKSTAFSLVAHQHVKDLINHTKNTDVDDPKAAALAAFEQAKGHDPNIPLYLRIRLNFEQKRKDTDEDEFHLLLGALQNKFPNDIGVTLQRAHAHGYYLNEWNKALGLYETVAGPLTYSDFENGQPRTLKQSETISIMGFMMQNNYEMAYKALRYRTPIKSPSELVVEVTLHCLTGNQEGLNNIPDHHSRSLSTYQKALNSMNYHSAVDKKLRSIAEGEVCSFFTEP